jgi:hypothetical protein
METTDRPPPYAFGNGHPSSPPMTPGHRADPRFLPLAGHTTTAFKRMARHIQSPPMEFIEPIGQGPKFHFTRPQSKPSSSRPSTASGQACATTPQDSSDIDDDDDDDDDTSEDDSGYEEFVTPPRLVDEADVTFVIEELDSAESGYDSDVEVLRPDHFEDAKSDKSGARLERNGFIDKFKELHCQEESSDDEEERQRIYRRKKKRWSAGIFKRSHSQSVEGDSSYSDNDPLDDIDSTARRLRRRVRGPGDSSLVFEDRGFSNANNHIVEVEEPEEYGDVLHSKGPPSIPSDDAFTLDELPFWDIVEDSMDDVEYESP